MKPPCSKHQCTRLNTVSYKNKGCTHRGAAVFKQLLYMYIVSVLFTLERHGTLRHSEVMKAQRNPSARVCVSVSVCAQDRLHTCDLCLP